MNAPLPNPSKWKKEKEKKEFQLQWQSLDLTNLGAYKFQKSNLK